MWKDINGAMRAGLSYSEMIETVVNPVREADWYKMIHGNGQPYGTGSRWKFYQQSADVDPVNFIRHLDIPILWFLAEKDKHVDTQVGFRKLQAAFEDAPSDDTELAVVKNANRAFSLIGPNGPKGYTKEFFGHMKLRLEARILKD